jgi:hypothetical protein
MTFILPAVTLLLLGLLAGYLICVAVIRRNAKTKKRPKQTKPGKAKPEAKPEVEKKPTERSFKLCLLCFSLGVCNVAVYWIAIFMDKYPDATVACTGIVEMIAPVLGYYIYHAKLKDSRNKYGIASDGTPYDKPQADAPIEPDVPDDNPAVG